jgi:DNA modification methylase
MVHEVLKPGKMCVVIVMDIRVQSQFIPFHIDVINMMKEVGFILEDIIIWDRRKEYSNLRPLGFPYVFIVNKVHEYILIFRRNKEVEVKVEEENSY